MKTGIGFIRVFLPAITVIAVLFLCSCGSTGSAGSAVSTTKATATTTTQSWTPDSSTTASQLTLSSPDFNNNDTIPVKYTCSGQNVSPALSWAGVPAGTKTLTLIVDDTDAKLFAHWVIFNIPADVNSLPEAVTEDAGLPAGALEGLNGFNKIGYGGPCPDLGSPHHYRFIIYALDNTLNLQSGVSKSAILEKMTGHVLTRAELIGIFQR